MDVWSLPLGPTGGARRPGRPRFVVFFRQLVSDYSGVPDITVSSAGRDSRACPFKSRALRVPDRNYSPTAVEFPVGEGGVPPELGRRKAAARPRVHMRCCPLRATVKDAAFGERRADP